MFACCEEVRPTTELVVAVDAPKVDEPVVVIVEEVIPAEPEPPAEVAAFEVAAVVELEVAAVVAKVEELVVPVDPKAPFAATLDLSAPGAVLDFEFCVCEENVLIVKSLNGKGAADSWNSTCSESQKMQALDRVVSVNGDPVVSSKDMAAVIKMGAKFELILKHPVLREINVKKNGKAIGLNLSYTQESKGLVVRVVQETGLMKEWNDAASADTKLIKSDRIISVNGKDGKALTLLEELKSAEEIKMVVASWA
ncbi:unnamed protein product [Polarella glacialis]|uniref:PDZ domain-containing protein n=1 Tax=Polarella glacialis TaxID=89957 RepID=A0A813GN10_POLGL|nr:unnamed protein product [Polarella glacialis]